MVPLDRSFICASHTHFIFTAAFGGRYVCIVCILPLQIKGLNKKIRQVEELETKVAAGSVVPSDEQRQKLARKPALLAELAEVRRWAGESG